MTKSILPLVEKTNVVLMGAGIMSATLGMMLKELDPNITIQVFERLDEAGTESSDAWNNAGTGHAAFCELNYTPEKNGAIDISKAVSISEQFEISREFWSYLVQKKYLPNPSEFISSVPHMSFVWGDTNVNYLRARFKAMQESPLFRDMKWSESRDEIAQWAPIVMRGRDNKQPIAATRMDYGTDVNFGALTRDLFVKLKSMPGVTVHYNVECLDLDPDGKGGWNVFVKNLLSAQKGQVNTKFCFIGAGGATLHLLKRAEISERKGYGGFPVSGLWLKCLNEDLIKDHQAKVYGKATVGAPPMSVPHIDTRIIDGKKELLFGPFAGFSTKFLKNGSLLDLPSSIRPDNALVMLSAGLKNIPLTKYLIEQLRLKPEDRIEELKEYVPSAKLADWELKVAGQRVQVIKKDKKEGGGVLEFGTEVVVSEDGTVAALLGASPGASTAAAIMFGLINKCFKKQGATEAWKSKIKEMAPSFGESLSKNEKLLQSSRESTGKVLNIK
ncbi:MAG: malate dehydrogenase (quinone) [Bacteroidota bacterium]